MPENPDDEQSGPPEDPATDQAEAAKPGSNADALPQERSTHDIFQGRLSAALAPRIKEIQEQLIAAAAPSMAGIQKQFADAMAPSMAGIQKQFADAMAPSMAGIQKQLADAMAPSMAGIQKQLADAMPRFTLPQFTLPPGFLEHIERLVDETLAPNWPRRMNRARLQTLIEVVQDDGIPLVWVPRSELMTLVLDAADRASRVQTLVDHRGHVTQDCVATLGLVTSTVYAGPLDLCRRAVAALAHGHHEAAQSLAVVVLDTVIRKAIGKKANSVKNKIKVSLEKVGHLELQVHAAFAPLHRFFTEWEEEASPHPRPDALSRGVTVHQADPAHFTEANALVAVMLATSVLRALDDVEESRDALGDSTWPWTKETKQ